MKPTYYLSLLAFTSLLGACSRDTLQVYPDDFKLYVEEFFQDAQIRGHDLFLEDFDLTIGFRDDYHDDRLGQCLNLNRHKISVRKSWWDTANPGERKYVIYHELGHCILNQKHHRGGVDARGNCTSIMTTRDEASCSNNYEDPSRWNHLVDELFNPGLVYVEEGPPFVEVPVTERDYLASIVDSLTGRKIRVDLTEEFLTGDFTIMASRSITDHYSYRLNLTLGESISFSYCRCTGRSVRIYSMEEESYVYESREVFSEPIRASIQKVNDQLNLYINELHIYTMPAPQFIQNDQLTLQSSVFSDEPIPFMDLEVYR